MATDKESQEISRRSFLKRTAMGSAGLVVATDILRPDLLAGTPKSANSTMIGVPFEARERVRLGIIGVGGRGSSLLQDLLAIENVEVKAICDLVPEKVARAQKAVTNAGQAEPAGFSKGELDFKNLTELELDIVYIATPWNWHIPMALSAMKNGKHAAIEVPACTTLQNALFLCKDSTLTALNSPVGVGPIMSLSCSRTVPFEASPATTVPTLGMLNTSSIWNSVCL